MKTFAPSWWMKNPHAQTIWPVLFKKKFKDLNLHREVFLLSDGDFIDLDWVNYHGKGPIVIILHGLEGSVHSHYAKLLLSAIDKEEWTGVFMHFRGCGGRPNRLPRAYHSGETQDFAAVVHKIRLLFPERAIAALGISLGANVLLKWLGETSKNSLINAAAVVSVPFDLENAVMRLNQGFSKIYQWHLLKNLLANLKNKMKQVDIGIHDLKNIKSIYDFDNYVTAPLHGFEDAKIYYEKSSCKQYLSKIRTPTLIIHAKDDPFMTKEAIPRPHELAPSIKFQLTDHGGHVGFLYGALPWKLNCWYQEQMINFLKAQFPNKSEGS